MTLVAGVDSSTQSCTVELRDASRGTLVGCGRAPHPATNPPRSEQHPHDWWAALQAALAEACADGGVGAESIGAIAVAAQCHGLVILDNAGDVIRPAKLWNDTTSAPQAAALVEAIGTEAWVTTIGLLPTTAFTITKLAWLAAHEPESLAQIATVLVPHDYLTFRLTGRKVTDRSDASGTGYFALTGSWQIDLLDSFVSAETDWAAALPHVLGPDQAAGLVQAGVTDLLGLRKDVVVGAGGGDQHLSAVGLGLTEGDVAFSLGTSGVVMSPSSQPVIDLGGWIDCVADATGGFLPLVCTMNATKVTDTMARLLAVDVDELGRLALAADPLGAHPTLVAYLDGERSPPRPTAQGLLAGLTNDTTRETLALAAFNGVLHGLGLGFEQLRVNGLDHGKEIVVTGGGAASPAYRQVLADLVGRPTVTRDAPDATARGAAVQAAAVLAGATVTEIRDAWSPPTTTVTDPRPGTYPGVPERYRDLASREGLSDTALRKGGG